MSLLRATLHPLVRALPASPFGIAFPLVGYNLCLCLLESILLALPGVLSCRVDLLAKCVCVCARVYVCACARARVSLCVSVCLCVSSPSS